MPADAADGPPKPRSRHTGKYRRKRVSLELDIDWSSVPKRETVEVDDEVEIIEVTDTDGDTAQAPTQKVVAVQQQQQQPPRPAPRRARAKTYGADRKKKTFKDAAQTIRKTKRAELAFSRRGGEDEDADIPAVPRPHRAALWPIIIALLVGLGGLFYIYGLAANLGAENTRVWLIAASTSFVSKMFLIQPAKVLFATGLMKCADNFRSETLERISGALEAV